MVIKINIDFNNGVIQINVFDLINNMPKEEKLKVVEAVTWDEIIKEAINRLTGESESWDGDDDYLTLDVLEKMEDRLLSGYKWRYLKALDQFARDMTLHEHLYWKMFHDKTPFNIKETYGDIFQKWFKINNIKSNYTHKLESYREFREMVEKKLDSMKNTL